MKKVLQTILLLIAFSIGSARAADEAPATVRRARQKVLFSVEKGFLAASVGGREASFKDLKFGAPDIELGGVRFRKASKGIQLSSDSSVILESPRVKGWSLELPANLIVLFELDIERQRMSVQMPQEANLPAVLVTEIGARMELGAAARGQIEFYHNGSYLFKGAGNITGVNSDGQKFDFRIPGTVISDGPLALFKPVGGSEYQERTSPTIALRISGNPTKDLQIKNGKEVVYQTGDTNSEVKFNALGASISFVENSSGSLSWKVDKGDFRMSVDGILGMITTADSGDEAVITWNRERKLADVKNLSTNPFRVSLPGRAFAIVNASAQFQFSIAAPGIFSAAAAGGDVHIYNGNGEEISNLQAGSLMIDSKTLRAGLTSGNGVLVRLTWDNGVPLEVTADQAYAAIQPGSERIVKFGPEATLKITYGAGGFLVLEAIRSSFKLVIAAVHGIEMDLVEGDSVSLTLDLKKGTFTIKADEHNVNDVAVTTESGYSPVLEAARALNFNIGKNGALLASSAGQPMFFAAGTGDIPTQGLNPPPPYNQNSQSGEVPIIVAPPVSVSGAAR